MSPRPDRKLRVILADDHAIFRHGLRAVLELVGDVEVVAECGDGEMALAAYREHRPDVLLLDLRMPRLDGLEVVRRVLENDRRAADHAQDRERDVDHAAHDDGHLEEVGERHRQHPAGQRPHQHDRNAEDHALPRLNRAVGEHREQVEAPEEGHGEAPVDQEPSPVGPPLLVPAHRLLLQAVTFLLTLALLGRHGSEEDSGRSGAVRRR